MSPWEFLAVVLLLVYTSGLIAGYVFILATRREVEGLTRTVRDLITAHNATPQAPTVWADPSLPDMRPPPSPEPDDVMVTLDDYAASKRDAWRPRA